MLPFVEIDVAGLQSAAVGFANEAQASRDSKQDYVDVGEAFDSGMGTFDTFQDGWASNAFKAGAEWGDGIADSVGNTFDSFLNPGGSGGAENIFSDYGDFGAGFGGDYAAGQMPNNISDTAKNTGKTADAIEVADEDLKYLRDVAEMEAINRFTTASLNIDFSGMNNTINNGMDTDTMLETITSGVQEAMLMAAEGVH